MGREEVQLQRLLSYLLRLIISASSKSEDTPRDMTVGRMRMQFESSTSESNQEMETQDSVSGIDGNAQGW